MERSPVFNTPGVVIRTTDVGDRDRMITLLTPEYGKLSVFARGVRKITSGSLPAAQLYAYADYALRRGNEYCYLREATIAETFLGISATIEGAALAAYLCETAEELAIPDIPCENLMQLLLNTLWVIANGKKPLFLIKGAFELRAAALAGYLPDIFECCTCKTEDCGDHGMIDIMNGRMFCTKCYRELYDKQMAHYQPADGPMTDELGQAMIFRRVNMEALLAMQYVLCARAKKQFSFYVDGLAAVLFGDACEAYILNHIGHGYKTLSFYKSVTGGTDHRINHTNP